MDTLILSENDGDGNRPYDPKSSDASLSSSHSMAPHYAPAMDESWTVCTGGQRSALSPDAVSVLPPKGECPWEKHTSDNKDSLFGYYMTGTFHCTRCPDSPLGDRAVRVDSPPEVLRILEDVALIFKGSSY